MGYIALCQIYIIMQVQIYFPGARHWRMFLATDSMCGLSSRAKKPEGVGTELCSQPALRLLWYTACKFL